VVLSGHVDDSYDERIYALAGWLSTADLWEQFSDAYEESGLPTTFHMKRERRSVGKRARTLAALADKYALYRVDCVLHQGNYDMVAKGKVPQQLDNPFFFLFYQIILAASRLLELMNRDDTIDWVFDEEGRIGTDANAWYFWIKEHAAPNIKRRLGSTPIFRDDEKVLPLKSADLLAWHLRRHLSHEQPMGTEPTDLLTSFVDKKLGVSCQITGEQLQRMIQHLMSGTGLLWEAQCMFHLFYARPLGQ
jgi:hypothetical protein